MLCEFRPRISLLLFVLMAAVAAGPLAALVVPDDTSPARQKEYRHPDLYIGNIFQPVDRLPAELVTEARRELTALGVPASGGYLDLRGGRWGTLMPVEPLIPGSGVGNRLTWEGLNTTPPADLAAAQKIVRDAFEGYLAAHRAELGIDVGEIGEVRVAIHKGELAQIHAPRVVAGVPVRGSFLTAVVKGGNLILFGSRNWGDIDLLTVPQISTAAAQAVVRRHLEPLAADGSWRKPRLEILPMAAGRLLDEFVPGQGYGYRLAWVVSPSFEGDLGRWEALVDATTGELLAFEDTASWASTREVEGGVLPVSNDGVPPDGVEQPHWPMPFTDVTVGGETFFTDAGGNLLACVDGTITTTLSGRFMAINDTCGNISESTAGDVLDLGTSPGTDCNVAPGASPGNTRSARSGFYEMNRIKQQARSYLPNNTWLQGQLTANMNINQNCNANWNGSQVNFFTSGGGCNNTGELAGVFDHEWGHGMDNNDVNPTISSPGEGIADIYAAARLNTSCIGRNFRATNCSGYGDPCTACTGVRDIDWANRASGLPHDLAWIDANCGSGGGTPCGGATHCEGAAYAESWWDLYTRDLQGAPYNLDANTALALATHINFLGAGPVGSWFQCVDGSGTGDGCNADGGYLNYLAADDDNANLNDGTPHMGAIFAAFDRHGIACATPTVQDSGCAGAPTTAPNVTATAQDRGARLTWGAVAGATKYQIFRVDGVFSCDFGKILVGETTGTEFLDSGLKNGHDYYYTVAAIGPSDSCIGPMSSCDTVTPVAGANLAVDAASAQVQLLNGDLDSVIDNCETGRVWFDIFNIGTGTQSNVRIVDVQSPSHPGITIDTSLPSVVAPSVAACGTAHGSFEFTASGISANDTVEFLVEVTSDELGAQTRTQTLSFVAAETSFQDFASRTFSFESDLEGWQVVQGTFNRTGGAAADGSFFVASSTLLDNQCDQIRSPIIEMTDNTALSVSTNFEIEPFSAGSWYDRANVALYDPLTGSRDTVDPSSGRAYNASGPNGACVTAGENGWADTMDTWASSDWSRSALGSVNGRLVQIDIAYSTDPGLALRGFWFDAVTLTNFKLQTADAGTDTCQAGNNPPLAQADLAQPGAVGSVTIPVLTNDSDPDLDSLEVLAVTQPLNGTVVIDPGNLTVTYDPDPGFSGFESFLYSITDNKGGTAICTVTVDFTGGVVFNDAFESGSFCAWSSTTP